jgi:transcriptional repressor NrdR
MNCPYCKSDSKVSNSRPTAKGTQIWRRRTCKSCGKIWTTQEVIDLSTSHQVTSQNTRSEPFSRDKLFISIKDSCAHRKSALADATALTDTVLGLVLRLNTAVIPEQQLIDMATGVITRFDKTAGAVYRAKHKS